MTSPQRHRDIEYEKRVQKESTKREYEKRVRKESTKREYEKLRIFRMAI